MKTLLLFSSFFFTVMFSHSQWSYTDLTEAKFRIGVTSLGTKVFFAGGESSNGQVSAVEIYDITVEDWDTVINLVVPRSHIASVSCGTKVFFAGGIDFGTFTFFDIVEIWDTETRQWSFGQLIAPRFSISAVSYGNKVMFAGGTNMGLGTFYDIVDVYNTETGEWSITNLSMARSAMAAAVVGDLAFFAGGADEQGPTDRVDIYNFTTGAWDIASLSQARAFPTATAVGTKVLIAGGTTPENESSSRVDIYDTETGEWSTAELSQARAFWESNAASRCNQFAYFVGGGIFNLNTNQYGYPFNTIDIYDLVNDEWTTDTTYTPVLGHSVIGVEDHLLIAAGMTDAGMSSRVQILDDTCIYSGVGSSVVCRQSSVVSYPNPTSGLTEFLISNFNFQQVNLTVYNAQGQLVATVLNEALPAGEHTITWNTENLPSGVYYYRLTILRASPSGQAADRRLTTGKLIKH
jgi:hypothetical protein